MKKGLIVALMAGIVGSTAYCNDTYVFKGRIPNPDINSEYKIVSYSLDDAYKKLEKVLTDAGMKQLYFRLIDFTTSSTPTADKDHPGQSIIPMNMSWKRPGIYRDPVAATWCGNEIIKIYTQKLSDKASDNLSEALQIRLAALFLLAKFNREFERGDEGKMVKVYLLNTSPIVRWLKKLPAEIRSLPITAQSEPLAALIEKEVADKKDLADLDNEQLSTFLSELIDKIQPAQ